MSKKSKKYYHNLRNKTSGRLGNKESLVNSTYEDAYNQAIEDFIHLLLSINEVSSEEEVREKLINSIKELKS